MNDLIDPFITVRRNNNKRNEGEWSPCGSNISAILYGINTQKQNVLVLDSTLKVKASACNRLQSEDYVRSMYTMYRQQIAVLILVRDE